MYEEVFFEVFESLPRQGPGSRSSTKRALDVCVGLPASPAILDLGSGVGAQTFHLAELTAGSILAIDSHAPHIERIRAEIIERGLSKRVQALIGDMGNPQYKYESFDLIWSEGALYNIGLKKALSLYFPVVKPLGYLAFTEPVWLKSKPPAEVMGAFEDYAGMGSVQEVLMKVEASEFSLVDHFTLPVKDWWNDFYTPMEQRIEDLRDKHTGDEGVLAVLDEIAQEPEMYRHYSDFYGYEFFVVRR